MDSKNKPKQGASVPQRDRFIDVARKLGADKDDGTLACVLGKVAPPVRPKPPATKPLVPTKNKT